MPPLVGQRTKENKSLMKRNSKTIRSRLKLVEK